MLYFFSNVFENISLLLIKAENMKKHFLLLYVTKYDNRDNKKKIMVKPIGTLIMNS